MSAEDLDGLDVSRETLARLRAYADLIRRWNPKINLVAPSTIPDLWQRHIVDSAQLFAHAPRDARHWLDIGSGGGLPGLVCAILAQEVMPECRFTLIESDQRKSAFLMTAARELGLAVTVLAKRVEAVAPQQADIVSARALAPLNLLLAMVARHMRPEGVALLPKGKTYEQELAAARAEWQFNATSIESRTDNLARLLIVKDIIRG
jgi:16S rRNA (guanine527-N7)-methyltransferase